LKVMRDRGLVTVEVMSDGARFVSHACTVLSRAGRSQIALTGALLRLGAVKQPQRGYDPGRMLRELAARLVDAGNAPG
jgi:hypothetical protein